MQLRMVENQETQGCLELSLEFCMSKATEIQFDHNLYLLYVKLFDFLFNFSKLWKRTGQCSMFLSITY